jgi:hypothetical protein
MGFRDYGSSSASADNASFTVTLTLNVEDAGALWNAAAEKALQAPGMTLADVLDTLGPREDPSIADCIAMLTAPAAIPGCALDDFDVSATHSAELIQLPFRALRPAANG